MIPALRIGILATALSACATGPSRTLGQLNAARERWRDQGISDYTMTVRRLCFCAEVRPVRVTVAGGVVVDRVFIEDGRPVPAALAESYPSVPGLFDALEEAARRADEIHVTFDPILGIPLEATIDYAKDAVDDEVTVQVSDFARR